MDRTVEIPTRTDINTVYTRPGEPLAPLACASCKKQKRRCDKLLPTCSLCRRIGRHCDYIDDTRPTNTAAEELSALRQEVVDLKNLVSSALRGGGPSSNWPTPSFPSLIFLDGSAFDSPLQMHNGNVRAPTAVLNAMGSAAEARVMVDHYFATVHTYFPILCRTRMYQQLTSEPGAGMVLLLLAMKLVCDVPVESAQGQLYQDVKNFYSSQEAQNGPELPLLQALVLISLYEIGHGIYPAAYLSTGHAARLGHTLGLHGSKAPQIISGFQCWPEQEEGRRTWWAVLILDWLVNIGSCGKRPLATPHPTADSALPADEAQFESINHPTERLSLSAPYSVRVSPFARTCQAFTLLGRVITHEETDDGEAIQLSENLQTLASVIEDEVDSLAICYNALLSLYETYSRREKSPSNKQVPLQNESTEGLSNISIAVLTLSRRIRMANIQLITPFVIPCLYNAAKVLAMFVKSNPTCVEHVEELKDCLSFVGQRWRVCGLYFDILWEARLTRL
ncbi:hypothetical protein K470DRAFT_222009 [Piedraia hortae CBS 480.64]|uniref:Zn(2)-C6 fungal-type domain-containing protein n=1 Tax=Piedraia hortae CBS 480.64 TaxID=1314780 RepID=A0A6A7BTM7_9PEZI|nr:hypothetical protein K470DRAFT_222009 [Piedraia hortae CBS 480.64]